jgi:hypothetical protein
MHPHENEDLKLIANNWDILQPAAEHGFEKYGRGMIFVDVTRFVNDGHPIQYVKLAALPDDGADCRRMVLSYDPQKEIVLSLLGADGLMHSYQVGRSNTAPLNLRGTSRE